MIQKIYIQIGVTALRTPTGGHYPAIPLFVEIDKLNASGLAPCEEKALCGFAGFASEEYGRRLNLNQKGADEYENVISCGV